MLLCTVALSAFIQMQYETGSQLGNSRQAFKKKAGGVASPGQLLRSSMLLVG
jgi:hypothetical protein